MKTNLHDVISLFARLGITAFGGPAAHIAMMRHEVVVKRKWMDDSKFLNHLGLTNLIPGPNSTELAIHIGKQQAGWKGLLAAGAFFILPAVLITGVIAWLYKMYGALPEVEQFVYGIKPAIIIIILMAVYPLARASVKNAALAIMAIIAVVLAIIGISEIAIIFGFGIMYTMYKYLADSPRLNSIFPLLAVSITNANLFFVFLKIGAILYGSGYVLFAFIDSELVVPGVLSREVLIDAIAVGQFTPGPVFSSVTFIGYQVNGFWGAVVSTLGIFLPSFVFVALLSKLAHLLERSSLFAVFLDAVNVASVAVIAAVCVDMGQQVFVNWHSVVIALSSFMLLVTFRKINSAYIVMFGSVAGFLLTKV